MPAVIPNGNLPLRARTSPGRIGCLAAVALGLVIVLFPYLLTVWSASSFCFAPRPHFVSGEQKVSAALDFLVRQGSLSPLERSRINPANCCRIDKGGGEEPPIGLETFIFVGTSHYVHVPAALIPHYDSISTNLGVREGVFAMNSCGVVLNRRR